MVAHSVNQLCWLLAQTEPTKQIAPTMRAAVMMALLAIALLGLLLVVIILLGGHWVRRQGSHRRGPVVPPDLLLKKNTPPTEPKLPNSGLSSSETDITNHTRNS